MNQYYFSEKLSSRQNNHSYCSWIFIRMIFPLLSFRWKVTIKTLEKRRQTINITIIFNEFPSNVVTTTKAINVEQTACPLLSISSETKETLYKHFQLNNSVKVMKYFEVCFILNVLKNTCLTLGIVNKWRHSYFVLLPSPLLAIICNVVIKSVNPQDFPVMSQVDSPFGYTRDCRRPE